MSTSSLPAASTKTPLPHGDQHIALIGLGAIGISFLALHLTYTSATISVFDPRPDLKDHVASILPLYLPSSNDDTSSSEEINKSPEANISSLITLGRLRFCTTLQHAVQHATIVQEQGPENLSFKQKTWTSVLQHTSRSTHLWSSTSGIPASQQLAHLTTPSPEIPEDLILSARSRLLVVHPFNPPHLMPLLELIPSPSTSASATSFAKSYFESSSPLHRPIPVSKETPGFVANRLSFILFREACNLVASGVCSVAELDEIVRASLGPRWTVGGPFEMYDYGGGKKGLEGFFENIGEAIDGVWGDADEMARRGEGVSMVGGEGAKGWKEIVTEQTRRAYGVPGAEDVRRRDKGLREVVRVQEEVGRRGTGSIERRQ